MENAGRGGPVREGRGMHASRREKVKLSGAGVYEWGKQKRCGSGCAQKKRGCTPSGNVRTTNSTWEGGGTKSGTLVSRPAELCNVVKNEREKHRTCKNHWKKVLTTVLYPTTYMQDKLYTGARKIY